MKRLALAGAAFAAFAAFPAFAQPAPAPAPAQDAAPPLRRADVEQQLRDQFTRLDANHDGILTRQEAEADPGARGPGGPA
ncbi:MAG: hypothetical protein JWO81_1024, partial [Alphaproteobacteria bacterium]|nr:hypothetical protein [Alphaproteobacteria bacterium]